MRPSQRETTSARARYGLILRQKQAILTTWSISQSEPVREAMGMPASHSIEGNSMAPSDAPSWKAPRSSVGGILVVLLVVLVPLAWVGLPREIARWYVAAAEEADLQGRPDEARQKVDLALDWHARCLEALLFRAQMSLDAGDLEAALKDASLAVDLQEDAGISARMIRSLVYQRRGEHSQALQDLNEIVQFSSQDFYDSHLRNRFYAESLNNRAYGRALAHRELEAGLEDAQKAIELAGPVGSYLDTRGYLFYLMGKYPEAVADLEEAVRRTEADRELEGKRMVQESRRERLDRSYREALAVIYHHRGLAYEKIGRSAEAAKDLERATEYGYDPKKGVW